MCRAWRDCDACGCRQVRRESASSIALGHAQKTADRREPVLSSRASKPRPRTRPPRRAGVAMPQTAEHLSILIANEQQDRLALVAALVTSLGHEVIAPELRGGDAVQFTHQTQPDVALVGV